VVGAKGVRSIDLVVFCPRRVATIPVDACERCPALTTIESGGERPAVACDAAEPPATTDVHVGALAQPTVLCVRRETPLDALDGNERQARVIPVVDDEERYVGAIVFGRASSPPPSSRAGARLAPSDATADDALESLPAVDERSDVVSAAATMTSTRARCLPVVSRARVVVGLLDDVALLASIAKTRRASEVMKRCSCGRVYTRDGWMALPLVGFMQGSGREPMELRNCGGCGSTMAVPADREPAVDAAGSRRPRRDAG
jgi:CBS domain-containing protein